MFIGTSAQASTGYVDGISDQSMPAWDGGFSGSYFAAFFQNNWINPPLHVQYARYVVQWNVMNGTGEPYTSYRQRFEEWLNDASAMGLALELAVTEYSGTPYPSSSSEYKSRLKEVLSQASAQGHPISYLEPWNEPNGQGKESAVAAAHFANEGNATCKESPKCTVVAGNAEDSASVTGYLKEYRENLNFTPSNWGVHPYWSVEHREEKYYNAFLEGLPSKGEGAHIWFTEVAARRCTASTNNGEIGQAERAQWLMNTLMPYAKPEHVFYWEFLLGERRQPACGETDDALYVPSSDPNAPDAPRPAAAYIYGGSGFPWGYTGSPGVINATEETLTGSVYPGGVLAAKYHFEYGTTASYGSYSAEGGAGSGLGGIGESATLTGLTEGTTYHYRIAVWNTAGADYGADTTFTTPRRPTVTTEPATEVRETSAVLHGSINPNASETHYYFQYGETTGYGSSTATGNAGSGTNGVPESATISGLQPGVTYHYRLVATNVGGTSNGGDQTFTTPALTWAPGEGGSLQQVFYVGSGGTVYEAYVTSKNEWVTQSVSSGYGATGRVTWAPGQSAVQELFYVGSGGTVYEAYMTSKNEWITQSISSGYGASGPVTFANNQVFYVGSGGTVYEAYSNENRWITQSISSGYGAAGQVTWATGEGGSLQQVFYAGSGGTVYEAYANPENKWVTQSVSSGYGATGQIIWAPGQSAVQELFYVGSGGTVYEAYMTSKNEWITQSISSGYGA
ncbi:MAG: hypothetical protein WB998_12590 [Solirubrobacteraceae bacterium]